MGKHLNEDTIMIACSPIQNLEGSECALVNIYCCEETRSRYCGIQIPQLFVSYNRGFSDEEMAELLDLVDSEKGSLWCKAQDTKPYSDQQENLHIIK